MTDYAYITVTNGNNGIEIGGNTQAETVHQLKRIADALEAIQASQAIIAAKP